MNPEADDPPSYMHVKLAERTEGKRFDAVEECGFASPAVLLLDP